MESSDAYKKAAFILSTPELAELFFTAIGVKHDPEHIIFNNYLEIIIYNSPDTKTVLYNRFCTERNTILLLFISQLLFEKSMTIKMTLMDFRGPSKSSEEREISLYKALLDPKEFDKLNINREQGIYVINTLALLRIKHSSLLNDYDSFSVDNLKSIKKIEYYHLTTDFVRTTYSNHIIIIDFAKSFSIDYLYLKILERKVVVDVTFGNTKGLETIITTSKNGFKLLDSLSDEKFKVYYREDRQ